MAKINAMAFALIFSTFSFAKAEPSCGGYSVSALCRLPIAAQEVSTPMEGRCALLLQDAWWGRVLHSSSSVRRQEPRLFLRVPRRSAYSTSQMPSLVFPDWHNSRLIHRAVAPRITRAASKIRDALRLQNACTIRPKSVICRPPECPQFPSCGRKRAASGFTAKCY